MWFCLPAFASTTLWFSGTANYLWPTVLILGFFLPYRFNLQIKKYHKTFLVSLVVLGILAAMSNEVGGSTAVLVTLLFRIYNHKKTDAKNLKWQISGVLASGIAFLAMLKLSSGSAETQNYGQQLTFWQQIPAILKGTWHYSGLLLLPVCVFAVFFLIRYRKIWSAQSEPKLQRSTTAAFIFLVSALAGCGALIASPILPGRMWFAVNILLLLALLQFIESYRRFVKGNLLTTSSLFIANLVLIFLALPNYNYNLQAIKPSYNVFYTHEQLVKKAQRNQQKIVKMPGMPPSSNTYDVYTGTPYIITGNPKKQWMNTWMAKFWKVDTVLLDNSVSIQSSPQKDLAPVHWILQNYRAYFGNFQTKHFPVAQPLVKKTSPTATSSDFGHNPLPDNHNLPKNKPWLRNALIRYIDIDTGKIVGTERITSPYNDPYDISHAAISGYQTLPNQPKSYLFTRSWTQTIDLKVKARTITLALYFQNGSEIVRAQNLTAKTGQTVTVNVPTGYLAAGKKTVAIPFLPTTSGMKIIQVRPQSFLKTLKNQTTLWLLCLALLIFLLLDFLLAFLKNKSNKKSAE